MPQVELAKLVPGCAKYGARLILCARRVERLEQLAKELHQRYGKEHYILPLDVREHEQVKKQLDSLPSQWQSIEILINNAGLALDTLPVQQGIEEHWDIMIDTNIKGLLYVSRALIPGMLERGMVMLLILDQLQAMNVIQMAMFIVQPSTQYMLFQRQ